MAGKRSIFLIVVVGWIGMLLMLPHALGQIATGRITGTVTDTSGAVIPNSTITLTNNATGISQVIKSGGGGDYLFEAVNPGTYTMTVEASGFEKSVTTGIITHIQVTRTINVKLNVGGATQQVTVTAEAPLLQAQDASVGQTIDDAQVNEMPLETRDWTTLDNLAAGVSSAHGTGNSQANVNGENFTQNDYRLNGVDDNAEIYSNGHITGPDKSSTNPGEGYATLVPPPDAIQEFKVQSGDFSAEFGHSQGAVINAVIKSGTNSLHGDLWEYVRNTDFNANDFFANREHIARPAYHQNQFGGTVGGPVIVPKIYHGKDKTFFFFSYQGTRVDTPYSSSSSVPTTDMINSDFTDFRDLFAYVGGTKKDALGRVFPYATIFDPATTRLVAADSIDPVSGLPNTSSSAVYVRDPFFTGASIAGITNFTALTQALNQLPAGRVDPNAQKLMALYPPANGTAAVFPNYYEFAAETNNVNQYDVRIDEHISASDYFFGTYDYSKETIIEPEPLPGIADGQAYADGPGYSPRYIIALGYTHVFSPTLVNEAHAGWNHSIETLKGEWGSTFGIPAEFGIAGVPQTPGNGGLPEIDPSNFSGLGVSGSMPTLLTESVLEVMDNVTKTHGSNSIKVGYQIDNIHYPIIQPADGRGSFGFGGEFTDIPNASTGYGGAAQMLLIPAASSVPNGVPDVGGANSYGISNFIETSNQRYYMGAYFQDDWRATHKLTLNLGLRWDYYTMYQEVHGHQANFIETGGGAGDSGTFYFPQSTCNTPISASFLALLAADNIQKVCTSNNGLVNGPNLNFAPRVGFAYTIEPHMVVRGGYGITYGDLDNNGYGSLLGNNYPFETSISFSAANSQTPLTASSGTTATLENALANSSVDSPLSITGVGIGLIGLQYNYKTSYQQTINLTVEDQFTSHDAVSIGYVAALGRHLDSSMGENDPSAIMPPGVSIYNPSIEGHIPFVNFNKKFSFTTDESDSSYNSMRINYQHQMNIGLFVLANYTFSKCMTDEEAGEGGANSDLGYRAPWLPGFGQKGDYAICDSNVAQVIHASGTYRLPFGRSRMLLGNINGLTNAFVGGWTTTFVYTHQTGLPINIACPVATTADFGCTSDIVPGVNMYAGPHNATQWLNPAAFINPPTATTIGQTDFSPLGGLPYQAEGPGLYDLDMSLLKEIPLHRENSLEFRAEAFNLPNSHSWANPSELNFQTPINFGEITSSSNYPRILQFALKLFY